MENDTTEPTTPPSPAKREDEVRADAGPSDSPPSLPSEDAILAPDVERLAPCEGAARDLLDRPSPIFLGVVAILTFVADIGTKHWAEKHLEPYRELVIVKDHLAFILAKNRGGAWGLLQGTNEHVRRPFFLLVSAAAILFIVALYRRLQPRQRALKWGLPLVLGGALGNVCNRIRYGHVIDFIDYHAEWLRKVNEFVAKRTHDHFVTDHWPTFNVADVAICVGVGLMAIDMFTSKRTRPRPAMTAPPPPPPPIEPVASKPIE